MSTDDTTGAYDFGGSIGEPVEDAMDDGIPTTFTPSADSFAHDGPRDVGIVFIGDGFVSGYGDPKGLGWVSRVMGRTSHPDLDVSTYNLGIRGECSADESIRRADARHRSHPLGPTSTGFQEALPERRTHLDDPAPIWP